MPQRVQGGAALSAVQQSWGVGRLQGQGTQVASGNCVVENLTTGSGCGATQRTRWCCWCAHTPGRKLKRRRTLR